MAFDEVSRVGGSVRTAGAVAQWRKHGRGGRGKRIPEAVCRQAAAVARVEGVLATARATGLSLERLQACVAAAEAAHVPSVSRQRRSSQRGDDALAQPHGPQFVSVQLAASRGDRR